MHRISSLGLAAAIALIAAGAAAQPAPKAQQRYETERARCESGQTQQDRATCLREAGAARDEAGKGNLTNAPAADLRRNATDRCNAQPPADREACIQRIMGAGTTQGSVEGGGVIRQTETPVK